MKDFLTALRNPLSWILASLFVALIGCGQQLDRRDEVASAKHAGQHQKQEAREARRQRAAQAMCVSDFGPHVLAVWVDGFSVECLTKRGRRLASYSMEVPNAE